MHFLPGKENFSVQLDRFAQKKNLRIRGDIRERLEFLPEAAILRRL